MPVMPDMTDAHNAVTSNMIIEISDIFILVIIRIKALINQHKKGAGHTACPFSATMLLVNHSAYTRFTASASNESAVEMVLAFA